MSVRVIVGLLLVSVLAIPQGVLAQQEMSERGPLAHIITWKVQPSDAQRFEDAVTKVVEAAGQAGLTSESGWYFYNDAFDYTLVAMLENFAYFDDANAFMKKFAGTPGEKMVQEAFAEFEYVTARVVQNEVGEYVADWSYELPGSDADHGFVHVDFVWLKPGTEERFGGLVKEYTAFLKEIDYPYAVHAHRTYLGDDRFVFVTPFDSKDAFYGVNDMDKLAEAKGASERMYALFGRFTEVLADLEHKDLAYQPSLSFVPEEMPQASQ